MLTIIRESSTVNAGRAYKVVLDGVVVGQVKNGQTAEFELTPGQHVLHLKIDWCRSNIVEIDSADGNERFACGGLMEGLIASIVSRNNYLYLLPS
jgi:hypothetical protein